MEKSTQQKGSSNRPNPKKEEKSAVNASRHKLPAENNSIDDSNNNSMQNPANIKLGKDDANNERDIKI